jgi:hypothetical protein
MLSMLYTITTKTVILPWIEKNAIHALNHHFKDCHSKGMKSKDAIDALNLHLKDHHSTLD